MAGCVPGEAMSELSNRDLQDIRDLHDLWIARELEGDALGVLQLCTACESGGFAPAVSETFPFMAGTIRYELAEHGLEATSLLHGRTGLNASQKLGHFIWIRNFAEAGHPGLGLMYEDDPPGHL